MTALDHTTCNQRQPGISRKMLSLNFSSTWQWLPLMITLAGYMRAKSDYLDIKVRPIDESALALLVVLVIAGAGGLSAGILALRDRRPILARWCCLGALGMVWVPALLLMEGMPKLVMLGVFGSLVLVSCRIACLAIPSNQQAIP